MPSQSGVGIIDLEPGADTGTVLSIGPDDAASGGGGAVNGPKTYRTRNGRTSREQDLDALADEVERAPTMTSRG